MGQIGMKEILVATHNEYKRRLFERVFNELGISIKTPKDLGFDDKVDESGKNPIENALIKARFWQQKTGWPTFGSDASVEIDALGSEPGLEVRRWAGRFDDDVDDETWLQYLLERMKDVPLGKRTARGRSALVLVVPSGSEFIKEVIQDFLILEKPIRPYRQGSPLSAVRFNLEFQKPEAELTEEQQWSQFFWEIKNWKELVNFLKE